MFSFRTCISEVMCPEVNLCCKLFHHFLCFSVPLGHEEGSTHQCSLEVPATTVIKAKSALLNYSLRKSVGKENNRKGAGFFGFFSAKKLSFFLLFFSFIEGELQILLGCALLFSSVYLQDWWKRDLLLNFMIMTLRELLQPMRAFG